jgi:glycosyltransferase involved in cell wall biosynthesis
MNLADVTPLILTYNEEANIARTLAGLTWARQIVVIDSGSSDATVSMIEQFKNVRLVQRPFDNHTAQWNFGLDQIETPWVLALDADYNCPPALADELSGLAPNGNAYAARFRYCIHGRPLRGTLYPPRVVLFRAGRFRYVADGHTQKLDVSEPTLELKCRILHDDRKPLARWLMDQSKYADQEVRKLLSAPPAVLGRADRLRKKILWAAPATFFYCLFVKSLFLDGCPGFYYTLQRVYAELLLALKLLEAKTVGKQDSGKQNPAGEPNCKTAPHVDPRDDNHSPIVATGEKTH